MPGTCQQLPGAAALRVHQMSVCQSRCAENAHSCIADTSWDEVINASFVFLYSCWAYWGLKGWMKAHKLLYVCFEQHASHIMYCEQEIQKIQNLSVSTEWTLLHKGTSVSSWTESVMQCMRKSLLLVVVFLCKVTHLPCLFNRSRFCQCHKHCCD